MNDTVAVLLIVALFAAWGFIVRAVGKAAAKKNRRPWLWAVMTVLPLGPIVGPLWLASMPVAGETATPGQAIGRGLLIFLLVLSQAGQLAQLGVQEATKDKANSEYGLEPEDVTTHYKKMDVDEIVICLQLTAETTAMSDEATIDEGGDTVLFESQREADIYNSAFGLHDELECNERTYEYSDLDEAMERIEQGDVTPIRARLIQITDSVEARVARWNAAAPSMVDESTRFDRAELQGDEVIVHRFTLVEYDANEVSQADLIAVFEPILVSGSCSDFDLADLRNDGYTLKYEYRGRDGGYIGVIELVGSC